MSKPIANVTVAIGYTRGTWQEETFETNLTYEECKDQSLLLSEAEDVMDLGDDVSFIVMTNYEEIQYQKCCNCQKNDAIGGYKTDRGAIFELCGNCWEAFELGQSNTDKEVKSLDLIDCDDHLESCDDDGYCNTCGHQ